MIKYILSALLLALVVFGFWLWNKTDPQKLDFADRMAPGAVELAELPITGIAYGSDARQQLDIYAPLGRTATAHPVLIFFHGGSWRDGEREGYGFVGRTFASRGFVTVIADYRKSPKVRFPAFLCKTRPPPLLGSIPTSPSITATPNVFFLWGIARERILRCWLR